MNFIANLAVPHRLSDARAPKLFLVDKWNARFGHFAVDQILPYSVISHLLTRFFRIAILFDRQLFERETTPKKMDWTLDQHGTKAAGITRGSAIGQMWKCILRFTDTITFLYLALPYLARGPAITMIRQQNEYLKRPIRHYGLINEYHTYTFR